MLPTEDTLAERVVDPLVQREIQENEQLLWWSHPDPKRSSTHKGTRALERSVQLPVGLAVILVVLAVVFFFVPIGPFKSTHLLSLLLVIGAALVAYSLPKKLARYRAARQQEHTLAHTIYAITDQRVLVLIKTGHRGGVNAYSFTKGDIGRIERFEQDGWGDLIFGPVRPPPQSNVQLAPPAPRLAGIADVRRVEWLLLKTFKEAEGTTG
jgi:hypothetical protein